MQELRSRLTYANVMATLAVFIALGGGAWALSRGEVKSKHIAKGAVKKSDLARGAVKKRKLGRDSVNTRKVIDGSLLGVDFAPGELPQGEPGSRGPKGDQGASGLVDIQLVSGTRTVDTADARDSASPLIECPDGYTVIGGGAGPTFSVGSERWVMTSSNPVEAGQGVFTNDGWIARFETLDGGDAVGTYGFISEAICARTSD